MQERHFLWPMFQSAPLTEARGDLEVGPPWPVMFLTFQSAPLTEARGDPWLL